MKRILSLILCVLMLIAAVPAMAVSANEPVTAKAFDDVKEGKWYYEGVMWCADQGYMAGESETIFAPSKEMTRAMLVTVLAAIAGVDTSADEYAHSPFVDVKDGKWYTGAIVWANENKIATGISEDTFGYKNPVTREQLVLMVYQFMQMQGVDVSGVNENKYNACGDTDRVHSWAVEAMKWALDNEIVGGTGTVNGAAQISPRSTATRAQIAVIVKAMLNKNLGGDHPVGSLTLGEYDISEFAIVYGETHTYRENSSIENIAAYVRGRIAEATGVELSVYADTELPAVEGAKEILIGKTNREDAGLVTIDRSELKGDTLLYEMKDNYLILASNERYAGTALAANRFLEDVLGFTDYSNGIYGYISVKETSLENGTRVVDAPFMKMCVNYQEGGWDGFTSPSESSYTTCNPVHQIPMLACDGIDDKTGEPDDCKYSTNRFSYSHHTDHYMDPDPCLSDSHVIDTMIETTGELLKQASASRPADEEYVFWVTQSDGVYYCKCTDCANIYRIWGRCATYVMVLNYIAEAYAEEYPNVHFVGLAYKYTIIPPNPADEITDEKYDAFLEKFEERYVPEKDISSPGNTIMMVCTDNSCFSHAIDDPTCQNKSNTNVRFDERFQTWEKLFPTLYVWDYVNGDVYAHNPFPNIYEIWENYNYYAEHNVTGMYVLGVTDDYADFSKLRTHVVAELNWDPTLTEAEYFAEVDGFLKTFYGSGWTYVRAYIDELEKLSSENEWHIWTMNKWKNIMTVEQWSDNFDYLTELLDKAYTYADTDFQRNEVKKIQVQMGYIGCQLAYEKYRVSKDQADLDAFREVNLAYVEHINSIVETGKDYYKTPDNWAENSDPDNWGWN